MRIEVDAVSLYQGYTANYAFLSATITMCGRSLGETEIHHPSYPSSQDTFYRGNLTGVGRIYQQTFVDSYSKVAFCRLYTTKTPITAADALNDLVRPFFEQRKLPMLRILTDRGTEYCGRVYSTTAFHFLRIG